MIITIVNVTIIILLVVIIKERCCGEVPAEAGTCWDRLYTQSHTTNNDNNDNNDKYMTIIISISTDLSIIRSIIMLGISIDVIISSVIGDISINVSSTMININGD